MKKIPPKISEHLFILLLVSGILLTASIFLNPTAQDTVPPKQYDELNFVNFNNPFEQALLQDLFIQFQGYDSTSSGSLVKTLVQYHSDQLQNLSQGNPESRPFSSATIGSIGFLFLKFILIYLMVLLVTYYGVQTLGVYVFMQKQQSRPPFIVQLIEQIRLMAKGKLKDRMRRILPFLNVLFKNFFRAVFFLMLFTPAYVVAYSIKSDFNTDSVIFLILLSVISNGLLITYTNKFFTLLITESRKGYVLTARVKNLHNSYFPKHADGIPYKSIFALRKNFEGHVFQHIFMNAKFQYLETIKEQASYVISGMVIIEMALNIHGYYNYEILQQLLYKNYHYVALMVMGIFILVKLTDIATEYLKFRWVKKIDG